MPFELRTVSQNQLNTFKTTMTIYFDSCNAWTFSENHAENKDKNAILTFSFSRYQHPKNIFNLNYILTIRDITDRFLFLMEDRTVSLTRFLLRVDEVYFPNFQQRNGFVYHKNYSSPGSIRCECTIMCTFNEFFVLCGYIVTLFYGHIVLKPTMIPKANLKRC